MKSYSALLAALAPSLLGAAGCDFVLDIDHLDQGSPVEVLATGQCNPGDVAVSGGFVYWTTVEGSAPCDTEGANAIARAAIGDAGAPVDVVTMDVDGVDGGPRAWSIDVSGGELYWLGQCGATCMAAAGEEAQGCAPLPGAPSRCADTHAMAFAGGGLYFAGGCGDACTGGGGSGIIERYDLASRSAAPLDGLVHAATDLTALSVSDTSPTWVAWIEGSPAGCGGMSTGGHHVLAGIPGAMPWDSCQYFAGGYDAVDVVIDDKQLFWLAESPSFTTELLAVDLQNGSETSVLVTGILHPHALALDDAFVYFTAQDGQGSVYAVPRTQAKPASLASLVPLATGRDHAQGDGPWGITAADPTYVYWLVSAPDGTVERILKPRP